MNKYVTVPAGAGELKNLRAGDYVYLTGTIYTARDAAHKRLYETAEEKKEMPVDLDCLLSRTHTGKGRPGDRFGRTYDQQPHG